MRQANDPVPKPGGRVSTVTESIRDMLASEAAEAVEVAAAEQRGDREPSAGQRARGQTAAASQVDRVRLRR